MVEGVGLGVERDGVVGMRREVFDEPTERFGVGDEREAFVQRKSTVC